MRKSLSKVLARRYPYLTLGLKRLQRRSLLNEFRDSKRSRDSSTQNIISKTLFNDPPGGYLMMVLGKPPRETTVLPQNLHLQNGGALAPGKDFWKALPCCVR